MKLALKRQLRHLKQQKPGLNLVPIFIDIRGVYDNDLIGYLRWTNGEPDIFYLLHDGDVVYDGLAREAVATPFEFD